MATAPRVTEPLSEAAPLKPWATPQAVNGVIGQTPRREAVPGMRPFALHTPQDESANAEAPFMPLSQVVKGHVISVYQAMGCNKTRAARVLEIDIKTLYNKLRRYGIS